MSPICVIILNLSGSVLLFWHAVKISQPERFQRHRHNPAQWTVHWRLCNERSGICYHKCRKKHLNYKSVNYKYCYKWNWLDQSLAYVLVKDSASSFVNLASRVMKGLEWLWVRVSSRAWGLLFISYKRRVNTKIFQTTVSKPQGLRSALGQRCQITKRLSARSDSKESTIKIHKQ